MASTEQTRIWHYTRPSSVSFPKHSFGKKRVVENAFKAVWFNKWNWLHYNEAADAAFCHVCATASQHGKLKAALKDLAVIQRGFSNWKDAKEGFRRKEHEY